MNRWMVFKEKSVFIVRGMRNNKYISSAEFLRVKIGGTDNNLWIMKCYKFILPKNLPNGTEEIRRKS
jgi:hypothetical protein